MTEYRSKFENLNNYDQWLIYRQMERDFAFANGLNNGDPETNGEFLYTDYFLRNQMNTFLDIGANKVFFHKEF